MMPTDLTKLREQWEDDRGVKQDILGAPLYGPPITFAMIDDLIQRAYRQGVEDCIVTTNDLREDWLNSGSDLKVYACDYLLSQFAALKGEAEGEEG